MGLVPESKVQRGALDECFEATDYYAETGDGLPVICFCHDGGGTAQMTNAVPSWIGGVNSLTMMEPGSWKAKKPM